MCVFLLVYCLYETSKTGEHVCRQWLFFVAFFLFQNLFFLFFLMISPNKFNCMLSSSNQAARDILEKE